jgi:hypothetical protein
LRRRHDDQSDAGIGDFDIRDRRGLRQPGDGAGLHPRGRQCELCDDGRRGLLSGDAIIWPDGTRSSLSPHPSVIIGNKSSVTVGPGVFVGQGKGMVPLDNPNAPNKTRCAVLDGASYCY